MAESNKNKKGRLPISFVVIISLFSICIIALAVFSSLSVHNRLEPANADPVVSGTTQPPVPVKISEATIGSTGDVLIHVPIFNAAYSSASKTYDFSNIFTCIKDKIESYDYFVANLETTLAGNENGRKYTGYPCFNTPDAIVDALKSAGVDCLLTANNHCYDTGSTGVKRTQETVKAAGLDYTGTRQSQSGKKYLVKDVNGINIGMICYTYETKTSGENRKALNGILVDEASAGLINSFAYEKLDKFYTDIKSQISKMKKEGADVLVAYLHWGNEYQLEANSYQKEIAQKLCDLGVDVIIGGHPHVVQPVDLITSTDGKHKMVCVYSMGNMVSNQRRNLMGLKTGNTEDGMIFEMTVSKYSDGSVYFEKINVVPTWVNLYTSGGKSVYSIVPLDGDFSANKDSLGLSKTSNGLSLAEGSFERTMKLVSDGVKKSNSYFKSVARPSEGTVETTASTDLSAAA